MDRPNVTQDFVNKIDKPYDLPDYPWVQWRVDNVDDFRAFLEDFMVRIKSIPGHQLLIQGAFTSLNLQLSPGDCLVLWPSTSEHPREQLGVVRADGSEMHREGDGLN